MNNFLHFRATVGLAAVSSSYQTRGLRSQCSANELLPASEPTECMSLEIAGTAFAANCQDDEDNRYKAVGLCPSTHMTPFTKLKRNVDEVGSCTNTSVC